MLACSLGGDGHLIPLANARHALRAAGHEVLLLVPPALEHSAERTGLSYRVGDEPARAFVDEIWERVRRGPAEAVSGLIDRELFADRCTDAMLAPAREVRDAWQAGAGVVVASEHPSPGGLRTLGPDHVAPLRASIEPVLETPAYRLTARQIAAEIAALPALEENVAGVMP